MTTHSSRSTPTSVGVVGAGNVTTTFHLPILSALPDVDISYVADIDGAQARTFANIYGGTPTGLSTSPSSLPDTDVVLLATPVGVRDVYVDLVAEMGAALFAEKPFAVDTDTHREFLDQLSAPATCNYMRTTYSSIQQLTALVDSGAFGPIESVSMTRGLIGSTGISAGSFRTDSDKSGGGVLIEKGCHDLSQLVEVFGDAHIEVVESEIT
jgi:predicted dehydrogenase